MHQQPMQWKKKVISKLLEGIDEEDVSISLLTTHYQNKEELQFFCSEDQERVVNMLRTLSEDSSRHKAILKEIIHELSKI